MKIKFIYLFLLTLFVAFIWKKFAPLSIKERIRFPIIFIEHNLSNFRFDNPPNLVMEFDTSLDSVFLSANPADSNAIQNAIDKINQGNIFLVDSVYSISSPIIMKSNVYLIGRKQGTKIINRVNLISGLLKKSEKISDSLYIFSTQEKLDIFCGNIIVKMRNSFGFNQAIFRVVKCENNWITAKLVFNSS